MKGLAPRQVRRYVNRLYRTPTASQVDWPWLTPPLVFEQAQNRIGLQWADIAAMALHQAIVPKQHPPHRVESAYMEALAGAVWGKRELEAYAFKSMIDGWHATQGWWPAFTVRVPVQ